MEPVLQSKGRRPVSKESKEDPFIAVIQTTHYKPIQTSSAASAKRKMILPAGPPSAQSGIQVRPNSSNLALQ